MAICIYIVGYEHVTYVFACTYIYIYIHTCMCAWMCMPCVSLGPLRNGSVMSSEVPSWNQLRHEGTTSVHSLFSFIVSWYRACKILNMGLTLQIYLTPLPDIDITCAYCRTVPVYIVQYRCDLEKTQVGLLKWFWMQQRRGMYLEWLCLCRGCSRHLTAWSG